MQINPIMNNGFQAANYSRVKLKQKANLRNEVSQNNQYFSQLSGDLLYSYNYNLINFKGKSK